MPRFKEQAVCLRHVDWSETSQVVVMLTQNLGKVRGLAKGSKRMSPSSIAKFSGGIELLSRGQACGVTRPNGQLTTLTEWDLQESHPQLRRQLLAHRMGLLAAETCDQLLADEDPHPTLFTALTDFLTTIGSPPPEAPQVSTNEHPAAASPSGVGHPPNQQTAFHTAHAWQALAQFQWAALVDTGYQPQVFEDVRQHTPLAATPSAAYSFDPDNGGLTTTEQLADWRVRPETVACLQTLAQGQTPFAGQQTVATSPKQTSQSLHRVCKLLVAYTQHVTGKPLLTAQPLFPKN